MTNLISMEDNRALEDKIERVLKTKNFIVFYTLEDKDHKTGLIQGTMSLTDISLYSTILQYMATAGVSQMYDDDIEE